MEQEKRFYRSRFDSIIGGVSGGLARYFDIDPILIRILFVVLALLAAGGVLLYIILWIAMPLEPDTYFENNATYNKSTNMENEESTNTGQKEYRRYPDYKRPKNDGSLIAGIILITIGGMFLIDRFIPRIDFGDLWPVLLIVVGVIIIAGNSRNRNRY